MKTRSKFIYPGHEYSRTRNNSEVTGSKKGERTVHRMTQNKYWSKLPADSSGSE